MLCQFNISNYSIIPPPPRGIRGGFEIALFTSRDRPPISLVEGYTRPRSIVKTLRHIPAARYYCTLRFWR